jgi:hypothetical protein
MQTTGPDLVGIERQDSRVLVDCRSRKQWRDNHPRSGGKTPTKQLVVRGLELLKELAGERFRRGIVLYSGRQCVPLGKDPYALPIESLWRIRAQNKRA